MPIKCERVKNYQNKLVFKFAPENPCLELHRIRYQRLWQIHLSDQSDQVVPLTADCLSIWWCNIRLCAICGTNNEIMDILWSSIDPLLVRYIIIFPNIIIIIISSYSFNVRDPKTHTVFQASALARVGPPVIFLQAQRSCAISSFIPIAFMSLLTQLLHVFLGAPLSTTPITFILVHFFTQLFSSFRSTCPNHLNLPLCILFSTHSMPKRFKSSSLRFLSFKDTPHILLTIILSALLNLARSSAFIAQVSLPYTNTLCTQ